MARPSRYSPEVRERAVRMAFECERDHGSQWTAIVSIAEEIGCTPETLRLRREGVSHRCPVGLTGGESRTRIDAT